MVRTTTSRYGTGLYLTLTILSCSFSSPLRGQVLTGIRSEDQRNGFDIYGASASFGYSSYPGSFNITGIIPNIQGGYTASANTSLSYVAGGPRLRFGAQYTPSYAGAFYGSNLNSFNQSLSLELASKLSAKWAFSLAGYADDATIDQFVFKQNGFSEFVTAQGTPDQFAKSIVDGSSAGLVGIPQTLIYGSKVLILGANASANYRPTTRLGFAVTSGFNEMAAGRSNQPQASLLIARTTFEHASVGFTYSLSERDEFGAKVEAANTSSRVSDFRAYSYLVSYGRRLTEHLFANAQGGISNFSYVGGKAGHTYIGTGILGFKNNRGQTWAVTAGRKAGDLYGLTSSSSTSAYGSWHYRKPGAKFGFQAFGGTERLSGGALGGLTVAQAGGSVSRSLARLTSTSVAYAFMGASKTKFLNYSGGSTHAVRLSVYWVPRQLEQGPRVREELQTAFQSFDLNPKDSTFSFQPREMKSMSWRPWALAPELQ